MKGEGEEQCFLRLFILLNRDSAEVFEVLVEVEVFGVLEPKWLRLTRYDMI